MTTPADIAALISEIRKLVGTMTSGGSLSAGTDLFKSIRQRSEESADQIAENILLHKKLNENQKKANESILGTIAVMRKLGDSADSIVQVYDLANRSLEKMVENLNTDELEQASSVLRDVLERSGGAHHAFLMRQIDSARDLIAVQQRLKDGHLEQMVQLQEEFQRYNRMVGPLTEEQANRYSHLAADARALGYTFEELNMSGQELHERNMELAHAIAETENVMLDGPVTRGFTLFGKSMAKFTASLGALAAIVKPTVDALEAAAQTGTQLELDAFLMGMQPEELNKIQAEYRTTILANKMSFDEFNTAVQAGTSDLLTYTGHMDDAIKLNAESMRLSTILGTDQAQFAEQQREVFKRFNRGMSMTVEQFQEMNKQLMDSTSVQSQLYRINVKQRGAYMVDLQQTYRKLVLDLKSEEAAKKMLEVLNAIGAKSPKERLKEAAKLQAVMGAFGMGAEGAEAGALLRGGMRKEGEKERFAEIMDMLNVRAGDIMGQGFESELFASSLISAAGVEQYLGPDSAFADYNIRQANKIDESLVEAHEQTRLADKLNGMVEQLIKIDSIASNFFTGTMGSTMGALAGSLAAFKLTGGTFTELFRGGAGPATSNIAKALTKKIPILGALAAGGFEYIDKIEELEKQKNLTSAQKEAQSLSTGAGAAIGAGVGGWATGALTGAAVGMAAGPVGVAIGALLGAGVGAWGGSKAGAWLGEMIGENISDSMMDLKQTQTEIGSLTQQLVELQQQNVTIDTIRAIEETNERLQEMKEQEAELLTELNKTQKDGARGTADAINKQTETQKMTADDLRRAEERKQRLMWTKTDRTRNVHAGK